MIYRTQDSQEIWAMIATVVGGLLMGAIGAILLCLPRLFPALLRRWNPRSSDDPAIERLERPSSIIGLRVLGVIFIMWCGFAVYAGARALMLTIFLR